MKGAGGKCIGQFSATRPLSATPRWEFVVHTNSRSTKVLHTNSTKVLHTNSTEVLHTNSTKVLHTNSTKVLHTNSTNVLHTNSTKVLHMNSTQVLHTNSVHGKVVTLIVGWPQTVHVVSPVLHAVT